MANICYNQPLLGDFATYFHATAAAVGWVTMASQAGYGIGLLFLLPLGDIMERRKLVITLTGICALMLLGTAAVPSLSLLILGNFLIGATAMGAQILIPLAVEMAPPTAQGRTVGVMMTGLLGGVLLARTLAGFIGDHFGWRAVFVLAAGMMVVLAILMRFGLPHRPAVTTLSYRRLMQSLWQVLKSQPRLWRPAMVGALSFAVFMAFWTSLPFLMMIKFHEGATETGLFGVVGLAGALAAPYAGKVADRRGGNFTVSMALLITLFSFGLMWVWGTIPGLIVGVLLMDVGVQTVQVAEQGRVLSLLPEARSRLNTLYMVSRFMGGAIGSLIGAFAWTHGQWPFVCGSILALVALGIVTHVVGMRFEGSRDASRYAGAQEIATIAQKVV